MRVLHVLNGLGSGGVESLLLNWYKNIDRDKIQFDFLIRSNQVQNKDLIESMGGNIYITPSYPRHIFKNYIETKKLLESGKWNVVHVHANSAFYISALVAAKRVGIPCRIMHSHSINASNKLAGFVHGINKKFIHKYATHQFACSNAAGKWMFANNKFEVINNAIDIDKFKFNQKSRDEIRREFDLNDKFVIGHVGRFNKAKNHLFLIDIFKEVKKEKDNAVLLLVGEGELKDEVINYVKELRLEKDVIFAGVRNDIGSLLSSMDVFVFPSIYEGLPLSLVEAQTNGLICVASNRVPNEVTVTKLIKYVSLEETCVFWKDLILNCNSNHNRNESYLKVKENKYDLNDIIKELEKFYLNSSREV